MFKTPEELVEFFNKVDLDKSTFVMLEKSDTDDTDDSCGCGGDDKSKCKCDDACKCDGKCDCATITTESKSAIIESFFDTPILNIHRSSGNTKQPELHVVDCTYLSNACGAGLIQIGESTYTLNMCEQDGVLTAALSFTIDGKTANHKVVIKKLTEGNTAKLVLADT